MKHGTARAVAALPAVCGAWFALASPAVAAPGQIGYDGCLANDATQGCVDLPGAPLEGARGVAASPDSKSVYVASVNSDSIAHFFASGRQGQLVYDGCLASTAARGCIDLFASPLDGAYGVALSPDGRQVYVTAHDSKRLERFIRSGPQGQLTYNGCLETSGQNCIVFDQPLYGPAGVAVSRDGGSFYVAEPAGVARFVTSGPQGQLVYDGCLANDSYLGCTDLPGQPLSGVDGMVMSPDGRSVYVASAYSDSIAHFFVGAQGQLVYDGCLANNAAATGCTDLPGEPLDGASGVAVSPDGRSVYVASAGSDSVAHFFASDPQGQLVYDSCWANIPAPGCIDLPGAPLDGARGVAVSPDGKSVYVASNTSNSIAHFSRRPSGQLGYDGCLANDDAPGCANLPSAPLDGARGVTVSPDGRSVYVTSGSSHSIAHFFRALGDAPPPGSVTTPGTGPGRGGGQIGFGSKTLIRLKLAAKRIPARGPLPIVVTNANAFAVSGRLAGTTAKPVGARPRKRRLKLKSKSFRVGAERKTTVRLRLPRKLGRLLKRNGKLKLRLRAKLRDPAGNARSVTKTVTPRLKRKRKRTAARTAGVGMIG